MSTLGFEYIAAFLAVCSLPLGLIAAVFMMRSFVTPDPPETRRTVHLRVGGRGREPSHPYRLSHSQVCNCGTAQEKKMARILNVKWIDAAGKAWYGVECYAGMALDSHAGAHTVVVDEATFRQLEDAGWRKRLDGMWVCPEHEAQQ